MPLAEETDMRSMQRRTLVGAGLLFGLCLVALPWRQPQSPVSAQPHSTAPLPRSAAGVALWQARRYRTRAKLAWGELRGKVDAWDPQASAATDIESWRLQQLAADRDGNLREARRWALQAARLARTGDEAYRATELLVLLDHEQGHHEAEFQEAQKLLKLAPGSARARMSLRRAQLCYRQRVAIVDNWDSGAARSRLNP
jgi:hypothetical protein